MDGSLAPRYAPITTALGRGWFAYTAQGVALLSVGVSERVFLSEAEDALGARPIRKDPPASFRKAVVAALRRGDGSAVDWSVLSPFQRRVLEATARIPPGSTRSYGEIARRIGKPRAQRAVGTALARNPVPLIVPCHRVVRSDGSLGNYGMGGAAKRTLLDREGYRSR